MTCTPATCPNGKCNATGECVEKARPSLPLAVRLRDEAGPPLPQMIAQRRAQLDQSLTVGYTAVPINAGHGHVRARPDGMKARCGGPALCNSCKHEYLYVHGEPWSASTSAPASRTIVAFTGLAGSGKSTAAQYLVERHGFHRVRFAGPLKAMMAALGCTPEQIDGSEKEMPCDLLGGKTPRHAMQTLGSEWGRDLIAPDLWIRAWQAAVAKVTAGVPIVVDDCRFPNEGDAVRAAGGVIVRVERPGAGTTSVHQSEQHQLEAAETLRNIADKRYLFDLVDILVTDLSWRDLEPQLPFARAA